jgi:hypothetical protein
LKFLKPLTNYGRKQIHYGKKLKGSGRPKKASGRRSLSVWRGDSLVMSWLKKLILWQLKPGKSKKGLGSLRIELIGEISKHTVVSPGISTFIEPEKEQEVNFLLF